MKKSTPKKIKPGISERETPGDENAVRLIREAAENGDAVIAMAEVFSAMGDPTRLKILTALLRGECRVGEIAVITGMSPSATSHQLRVLRVLRLVKHRREGQTAVYSLDDGHIVELLRIMTDHHNER